MAKMYLNFILNNTHINTPVAATMLNHAALHEDKTIATQSNAKLDAMIILLESLMFGMNKNAAFKTKYIANAAP
jgi:hypothetical protein